MLDLNIGYLKEIEEALKQLHALGTLIHNACQPPSDPELPPDWRGSGKMIVSLSEQGLEAWTDLFEDLAGDHGQKKKEPQPRIQGQGGSGSH